MCAQNSIPIAQCHLSTDDYEVHIHGDIDLLDFGGLLPGSSAWRPRPLDGSLRVLALGGSLGIPPSNLSSLPLGALGDDFCERLDITIVLSDFRLRTVSFRYLKIQNRKMKTSIKAITARVTPVMIPG